MTRNVAIFAAALVVLGLAGIYAATSLFAPDDKYAQCRASSVAGGAAAIGGPFTLVSETGETVTEKDVIDQPSLVYFGYTFCPDVCPLDMARNVEAVDLLDEAGINVTPVFITIDPARDTPQVLSDYVDVMHPKMIGLTGTDSQIASVAKAYKTFYRKNGEGEDYLMDHMRFTYLMSPDGFLDFIRSELTAEQVAIDVEKKAVCYSK